MFLNKMSDVYIDMILIDLLTVRSLDHNGSNQKFIVVIAVLLYIK